MYMNPDIWHGNMAISVKIIGKLAVCFWCYLFLIVYIVSYVIISKRKMYDIFHTICHFQIHSGWNNMCWTHLVSRVLVIILVSVPRVLVIICFVTSNAMIYINIINPIKYNDLQLPKYNNHKKYNTWILPCWHFHVGIQTPDRYWVPLLLRQYTEIY